MWRWLIIMDCKSHSSVLGHLSWPRLQPCHYTDRAIVGFCVSYFMLYQMFRQCTWYHKSPLWRGWIYVHTCAAAVLEDRIFYALHCHNTKVSCTHLSNCSTCIDGSFLTYATLPVVKASCVIISNQHTLVWSASSNVLYMLQFFAFTYTLHYMAHIRLQKSLIFYLTCSQWRVAKLCLLALTHLTASLSICLHTTVVELLNIRS